MRIFTIMVVVILVSAIGLLLFPPVHLMVDAVSISSFLPLTQSAVRFLPYMFLFFVGYAIWRQVKG